MESHSCNSPLKMNEPNDGCRMAEKIAAHIRKPGFLPLEIEEHFRRRGKRSRRGIADRAERKQGQAAGGASARDPARFHVERGSGVFGCQPAALLWICDHPIGGCQFCHSRVNQVAHCGEEPRIGIIFREHEIAHA